MNLLGILVEFAGTFVFLSVIAATGNPLAIAATLGVLIYLSLDISGGHFNPAVTIMTLFNNGIGLNNASGYIGAQILAGVVAISFVNGLKQRALIH